MALVMENSTASPTQKILDNIYERARYYKIQNIEDELKKQKEIKIYFDTNAAIRTIQGIIAFGGSFTTTFDEGGINLRKFKDMDTLIHCFAQQNWLGKIHMLPPHQDELLSKLNSNAKDLFPDKNEFRHSNIEEKFMSEIPGLIKIVQDLKQDEFSRNNENLKKFVENLRKKGFDLFKFKTFLERVYWKDRFIYLFQEAEILQIDNEIYQLGEIAEKPFFIEIKKSLDQYRQKDRSINNHIDALALTILKDKLDLYQAGEIGYLPIFMASELTYKAIESVEQNSHFSLSYEEGDFKIPIYRKPEYFLIDTIFTEGEKQFDLKLSEYYREFDKNKKFFNGIDLKEASWSDFSGIDENIQIGIWNEFFGLWLEKKGKEEVKEAIFKYIKYRDEQLTESVFELIEKDKAVRKESIKRDLSRFKFMTEILKTVDNIEKNIGHYKECEDVYTSFSLIRFSINIEKYPLIGEWYQNLVSMQNGSTQLSSIAYQIMAIMENENYDRLPNILGLLWVLGQKNLIKNICDQIKEEKFKDYDYRIALIYAASIELYGKKNREKILKITNCIEQKYDAKHYNISIGLSYVYFSIWQSLNNATTRLHPENTNSKANIESITHFFNKAMYHIQAALAIIEDKIERLDSDYIEDKEEQYFVKKYYAINNLAFYKIKTTPPTEIIGDTEIHKYIEWLENCEPKFFQPTFWDTIAHYYYKLAQNEKNDESTFRTYISSAKGANFKSMENYPMHTAFWPFSKLQKDLQILENRVNHLPNLH